MFLYLFLIKFETAVHANLSELRHFLQYRPNCDDEAKLQKDTQPFTLCQLLCAQELKIALKLIAIIWKRTSLIFYLKALSRAEILQVPSIEERNLSDIYCLYSRCIGKTS